MLRILAVDDEADSLRYLVQVLEPEHEVVAHTSSVRALSDLEQRTFDLVVADLTMPPPDGFEVLRRIQQMARPVPVIVLSAMDRARAVIDALQLGARDFVVKPATAEEIRAAIARVATSLGIGLGPSETRYGLAGRSAAISIVRRVIPLLARVRETAEACIVCRRACLLHPLTRRNVAELRQHIVDALLALRNQPQLLISFILHARVPLLLP